MPFWGQDPIRTMNRIIEKQERFGGHFIDRNLGHHGGTWGTECDVREAAP